MLNDLQLFIVTAFTLIGFIGFCYGLGAWVDHCNRRQSREAWVRQPPTQRRRWPGHEDDAEAARRVPEPERSGPRGGRRWYGTKARKGQHPNAVHLPLRATTTTPSPANMLIRSSPPRYQAPPPRSQRFPISPIDNAITTVPSASLPPDAASSLPTISDSPPPPPYKLLSTPTPSYHEPASARSSITKVDRADVEAIRRRPSHSMKSSVSRRPAEYQPGRRDVQVVDNSFREINEVTGVTRGSLRELEAGAA